MNALINAIISLVALVLALIPTWVFLSVKLVLSPQGFWQNFLVFGLGMWLLGGLQLFLLIIWVVFVLKLFLE